MLHPYIAQWRLGLLALAMRYPQSGHYILFNFVFTSAHSSVFWEMDSGIII